MYTHIRRHFSQAISSFTVSLPLLLGCGGQDVHPSVNLVDRTTRALSLGSFSEINGTFGSGCTNRSGAWSVGIDGEASLTNPLLSVVLGDSTCGLSVSSVRLSSPAGSSIYSRGDTISLGKNFWQIGSPFMLHPGDPAAFYINMRIAPDLTFASNFTVDMIYSEDPTRLTASIIASYYVEPVARSVASSGGISPPDYALDISGLGVQVNEQKVVRSATGNAALLTMSVPGQSYVVSTQDLGQAPSFAAVDAAFLGGLNQFLGVMDPSILIPADVFALSGVDLSTPTIRTLIVANEVAGTRSYEVFTITVGVP